jgi:hypothetical protein
LVNRNEQKKKNNPWIKLRHQPQTVARASTRGTQNPCGLGRETIPRRIVGAGLRGATIVSKIAFDADNNSAPLPFLAAEPDLKVWTPKEELKKDFCITAVKCLHYNGNTAQADVQRVFYKVTLKPSVVKSLQCAAKKILEEINSDDTHALVRRERQLIKSPRRLPNKALKRLRKRMQKKNSIQ